MQLRFLTLNIWGIPFISKSIPERLDALIKHLNSSAGNYDVIALQEVRHNCRAIPMKSMNFLGLE